MAQISASSSPQSIEARVNDLAVQLAAAQERLQQSQNEIQELQEQLAAVRAQLAGGAVPDTSNNVVSTAATKKPDTAEQLEIVQAEVKQHEQTKVESASKYPVHITGLVLFNSFLNRGSVDNIDFPSVAFTTPPGTSPLGFGGSLRQSVVGLQALGPHLWGARSYAELNLDFNGGIPYSNYGTSGGIVRMRTAALGLTWDRDTLEAGLVEPLISPLSPTSYATVAEPALAWSGNLWTWAPQLSYEHRFGDVDSPHFAWQFGLWDPPTAGYNTDELFRTYSTGERSAQPALESRLSFSRGASNTSERMQIGVSGYYSRQSYPGRDGDSWAATGDWKLPLGKYAEFSGELYRGRALGGLGGGVYKDVVTGTNPATGLSTFHLLNAAGGWAQMKVRFTHTLETNTAFGLDDGFTRDFRSLALPANAGNAALRARNQMVIANLIFSPKTYLILSPEYRRIHTWPVIGKGAVANIMTLSVGLRF